MNNKVWSLCILLVMVFIINDKTFSISKIHNIKTKFFGITVGTKTGDSTGNITISNSQIQQNIISAIPFLNGMNITSDQSYLIVTPITAYVVFKATNSSGIAMNVAVELEVNNSTLIFNTNNGREVHMCNSYGSCSACSFIKMYNRIITCNCSTQSTTNTKTEASCQHSATWLH